jgi:hypothetical protein
MTTPDPPIPLTRRPWFPRAFPFALYMLFIPMYDLLGALLSGDTARTFLRPLLYSCQIAVVSAALLYFRNSYEEIRFKGLERLPFALSIATGALVFILWIHMDWPFVTMGSPDVYDPRRLPGTWFYAFVFIRLLGSSVLVPIFEELFWRSMILRYIINPDFTAVKIGTFSWPSLVISSVLFGLEHHMWLAGIMAGVLYNLLLYRTQNLAYCVYAHAVTNFALGIYVLSTGNWRFW